MISIDPQPKYVNMTYLGHPYRNHTLNKTNVNPTRICTIAKNTNMPWEH